MEPKRNDPPRHESVDHQNPTDAGLMDESETPGTGIMGDETVVRPAPGVDQPGIAPGTTGEDRTKRPSGMIPRSSRERSDR